MGSEDEDANLSTLPTSQQGGTDRTLSHKALPIKPEMTQAIHAASFLSKL